MYSTELAVFVFSDAGFKNLAEQHLRLVLARSHSPVKQQHANVELGRIALLRYA